MYGPLHQALDDRHSHHHRVGSNGDVHPLRCWLQAKDQVTVGVVIKFRIYGICERVQLCILLFFGSFQTLSCTSDTGSTESEVSGAAPSTATLCKLMAGKTTFDEAKELLGKPAAQSGAMHDDVASLTYVYNGGGLGLLFVDGILSDAPSVTGIEYPDCWSD